MALWINTLIAGLSVDVQRSDVVLDSLGYAHFCCISNPTSSNILIYSKWDGNTWVKADGTPGFDEVDSIDPIYSGFDNLSIDLDDQDNPHITYSSYIIFDEMRRRYAHHNGSVWITEDIESAVAGSRVGYYGSVAVDKNNIAHVVYTARIENTPENDWELRYAKRVGGQWVGTDGSPGVDVIISLNNLQTGYYSSLVMDSNNNPCIACTQTQDNQPSPNTIGAVFTRWNGSAWVKADGTTPGFDIIQAGVNLRFTSLRLDSQDRPNVAYFDVNNPPGSLLFSRWDGSNWVKANGDLGADLVDNYGEWACLNLDSLDRPQIAYHKLVSNEGVLRYAYWNGSGWAIDPVDSVDRVGYYISTDIKNDNVFILHKDLDNGFKSATSLNFNPGTPLNGTFTGGSFSIPANAFSVPVSLLFTGGSVDPQGSAIKFLLGNGLTIETDPAGIQPDNPITVVFDYTDQNWIDAGVTDELQMKAWRWDEGTSEWVKIDSSVVDVNANTLTVQLDHLSSFAIGQDLSVIEFVPGTEINGTFFGGSYSIPSNAFNSNETLKFSGQSIDKRGSSIKFLDRGLNVITTNEQPVNPITVVYDYTDQELIDAGVTHEIQMKSWRWDEGTSTWIKLPAVVDVGSNTLTVQLDHLSEFVYGQDLSVVEFIPGTFNVGDFKEGSGSYSVPSNAFSIPVTLDFLRAEIDRRGSSRNFISFGLNIETIPADIQPDNPITVVLEYTVQELNNANVKNEDNMAVYRWDEVDLAWVRLTNSVVDTNAKTITVDLDHLSDFVMGDEDIVEVDPGQEVEGDWGTEEFPGGSFEIPDGAFDEPIDLTFNREFINPRASKNPFLVFGLIIDKSKDLQPNKHFPIKVVFTYTEQDLIDSGIKNEKQMKVYRWDNDEFEWIKIPGSKVDTEANTVTVYLDHLSDFNIQYSAPVWNEGYPNIDIVSPTSFDNNLSSNQAGTAYLVVVPFGAPAPTPLEVKNGQASGGGAPTSSGNIVLPEDTPVVINISGVPTAKYDVYYIAENNDLELQDNVEKVTVNIDPIPYWEEGYPKLDSITDNSADVLSKTDKDGNAWMVVVSEGSDAPSISQVKAGQDATGTPVASGFSGTVALTSNTEGTIQASNLLDINYDIYVVAENSVGGATYDSPVKLELIRNVRAVNTPREETSIEKETAQNKQQFIDYISINRIDGEIVFVGDDDQILKYVKLLKEDERYNILWLFRKRPALNKNGQTINGSGTPTAVLIKKSHWDEINDNYNPLKIETKSLTWFLNYAKIQLREFVSGGRVYLIKKSEYSKENVGSGDFVDIAQADLVLLSKELYDTFF